MLNIRFIKVPPTTFLIKFKRGKPVRRGAGLSFWYFAPTTSLVAIPLGSTDIPFIFKEITKDFQEVTLQGQLIYRIADPEKISGLMNFTLAPNNESYESDDPEKLRQRIASLIQVKLRTVVEQLGLHEAITASQAIVRTLKAELGKADALASLGIEVMDIAILAIKPSPETARALEAPAREQMLEAADVALYRRRNASIEQERAVKENELNTERAVEAKQHEMREAKLRAERLLQEQRQQMQREKIDAEIAQESQRKSLVELSTENERTQADAAAYATSAMLNAIANIDVRILEALTMAKLDPQQLLAQGIRDLAADAAKIGQLNFTPDFLQALVAGRN